MTPTNPEETKSGKLMIQYIANQSIIDMAVNDSNTQMSVLYEKEIQVYNLKWFQYQKKYININT